MWVATFEATVQVEHQETSSSTFCPIIGQFLWLRSPPGTPCALCPVRGRLCVSDIRFAPLPDDRLAPVPSRPPCGEKRVGEALNGRFGSNMVSARTHCPQCHRTSVVRLDEVFYAPNVDFFRCDSCRCMWHVEKGKDGPPSQTLLGHQTFQMAPKQAADGPRRKSQQ